MLSLAMYGWVFNLGLMLFLIVCFLLILMVMIQKPQGGGLSAAFGASSGSGQTAFGTKTGDALTVATILLFVVWLVVAMALNVMTKPDRSSGPAAPAAPANTPASTPANSPAGTPSNPPANTPASAPANTPAGTPSSGPEATPPANPAPTPPANSGSTPPANPAPATPEKPADPANPK
jgi:preprotein translocase subunit SecG